MKTQQTVEAAAFHDSLAQGWTGSKEATQYTMLWELFTDPPEAQLNLSTEKNSGCDIWLMLKLFSMLSKELEFALCWWELVLHSPGRPTVLACWLGHSA